MNKSQRLLFALALIVSCSVFSASAQIYVTVRPSRPVYVRTVAPSPRHVWIDEDWNGVGDRYEWHGGYWAEPPQPGYRYRHGYWRHSSRGDQWAPGRWHNGSGPSRGNYKYKGNNGNGHGKGHGNGHGNGHGRKH